MGVLTKTILLESAYFDPVTIRRASRGLGLSTESSYRFERGVDCARVIEAQDKAVALLCEFAGGRLLDSKISGRRPMNTQRRIMFRCQRANEILSLSLSKRTMCQIFEGLGFSTKSMKRDSVRVEIPSCRRDIMLEEDLIEECARIYGYDKIPSTMPAIRSRLIDNSLTERVKTPVRELLCALGFDEIITYSLASQAMLGGGDGCDAIRLFNPLSSEQEYLRPSLVESMLACAAYNLNRSNANLRFFEISHVFDVCYRETSSLGLLAMGDYIDTWNMKHKVDFFTLKGAIEALVDRLGGGPLRFLPLEESTIFSTHEAARIVYCDATIGVVGRIDSAALGRAAIKYPSAVFYVELSLTQLCARRKQEAVFEPLSIYPSVTRDMSLLAKERIRYEDITGVIESAADASLQQVSLIDRYRGEQIPSGCVSITISLTFGHKERTLTDREVDGFMEQVIQALKSDLGIKVRS